MINKILVDVSIIKHSIKNWNMKKNKFLKEIENILYTKEQFISSRSSNDMEEMNKKFLKIFKEELLNLNKFIGNDLNLKNVWVVHYEKYQEHIIHSHGPTGLSGVIYLNYDEKEHESTKYLMPFLNPVNQNSLIYQEDVKEGDLVMMPSFINHFTPINKSEKIRSIIGFDMEFKK
jgi:hypothetical protein